MKGDTTMTEYRHATKPSHDYMRTVVIALALLVGLALVSWGIDWLAASSVLLPFLVGLALGVGVSVATFAFLVNQR